MSADDNVLKSFLYEIGAKLDEPSIRRANDALDKFSKGVLAIGASVEAASLALAAIAVKMAEGFEQMYYNARKIGASANDINAYSRAIAQLGGNTQGAMSSLGAFAQQMRENRGGMLSLMRGLGVSTAGKNDMQLFLAAMQSVSANYNKGGAAQSTAFKFMQMLHVDEDTLRAIGNPEFTNQLRAQQKIISDLGVNYDETGKNSALFMRQVRDLGSVLEGIKAKTFSELESKYGERLVEFTDYIKANGPQIQATIVALTGAILKMAGAIDSVVQFLGGWKDVTEALFALWVGGKAGAAFLAMSNFMGVFRGVATGGAATAAVATGTGAGAASSSALYAGHNAARGLSALGLGAASGGVLGLIALGETATLSTRTSAAQGLGGLASGMYGGGKSAKNLDAAKQMIDMIQAYGAGSLSRSNAIGITANLQAESYGKLDPFAHNNTAGGAGAWGLGQWRGSRLDDYKAMFGHNLWDVKDVNQARAEQVQFMVHELNGKYKHVLTAMQGRGAAVSAGMFEAGYEVSATTQAGVQRAAAQRMVGAASLEHNVNADVDLHQTNNYTIHGSGDPESTQAAVATLHKRANQDQVRNFKGVFDSYGAGTTAPSPGG